MNGVVFVYGSFLLRGDWFDGLWAMGGLEGGGTLLQ